MAGETDGVASRLGAGRTAQGDGHGATVALPVAAILGEAESAAAHLAPKKRGKGRPKTIADMKAYKAKKERERRAKNASS